MPQVRQVSIRGSTSVQPSKPVTQTLIANATLRVPAADMRRAITASTGLGNLQKKRGALPAHLWCALHCALLPSFLSSERSMTAQAQAGTGWCPGLRRLALYLTNAAHALPACRTEPREYFRDNLHHWLSDRYIGAGDTMPPPLRRDDRPPQAHFCIARVCPKYRMIFLRTSKTGTTSVWQSFVGKRGRDYKARSR